MAVHLSRAGDYELCELSQASCSSAHLPGVESLADARQLPDLFLQQLLAAFDNSRNEIYRAKTPIEGVLFPEPGALWHPGGDVQVWFDDRGNRHRDFGLPAFIEQGAEKAWYLHGLIHRDHDLPAVVNAANRLQIWYQYDQIHRDHDLPALTAHAPGEDPISVWYQYGEYHRADGKPAVVQGYKRMWYEYGKPTRKGLLEVPGQEPVEFDPPTSQ